MHDFLGVFKRNWTKPQRPSNWQTCYDRETWLVSSPLPSSPAPPPLPQFQRPHRLRCFTQPMKCLKDTESVSWAWFPLCWPPCKEADSPSLCHACTHLPPHGHTHTEYGGPVAPMYNPPRGGPAPTHKWQSGSVCVICARWSIFRLQEALFACQLRNTRLDCTWTLLARRTFLFHSRSITVKKPLLHSCGQLLVNAESSWRHRRGCSGTRQPSQIAWLC